MIRPAPWLLGVGLALAGPSTVAGQGPGTPWEMPLRAGPAAPAARGEARLQFAPSPFGVAVTADGRHRYDVRITAENLPDPATLGPYRVLLAWETPRDLSTWHRLGVVRNGTSLVGTADHNKFLLVITAEPDSLVTTRSGPTVLHGMSPSGWLQQFLTHPLFRGMSQ